MCTLSTITIRKKGELIICALCWRYSMVENLHHLSLLMRKQSAYAKTEAHISFAVTVKLISAFVFAARIVQFIYFLNPKFLASSHLLCSYSSVCVRPVRKPGPSCSKLMMSLFNDSLKFQMAILQIHCYFLLINVRILCNA